MNILLWHHKRFWIGTTLLLLLALMLAACSGNSTNGNSGNTPTAHSTTTGSGTTPTTTPGIGLGSQPCPAAVKTPAYWDPIIPTQNGVTKVESVTCGNLVGNPTLQALVTVRYNGTGAILDAYVYTNITNPRPTQLFKLQSLYDGAARISVYNTVLTAEVDQHSSLNAGKDSASYTQDLFREFKWSDGTGTLVPVSFPAMYPDLTRYQAEMDQAQVNQGKDAWKLDAAMVANHMAADPHLLNWPSSVPTTVTSGGGTSAAEAVVTVTNPAPGGGKIQVTLQRLEGNTNGGIWEVVAVTSGGMSLTSPQSRDKLTNPIMVSGTGDAFEGVVGPVAVLDHLYTDIGHATAKGTGNGSTTFSASVTYNSTFKGGTQEGLVILYAENNAGGPPSAAVMLKVLIS
ncbi:MAG TPA: hypothetical protein VK140_15160 [Ktedonobacteraceae bacterium]|nr:hypothetical protein [Ktedonobacteraceae bacterium]